MGQGDLSGVRHRAASDDRGRRRRMMRGAKRPHPPLPGVEAERAHRAHRSRFEGLRLGHRRKDPGQTHREHRLPGAGRPEHQQVVAAGGGELECAPRRVLAPHVAQILDRGGPGGPAGGRGGWRRGLADELRMHLAEMVRRETGAHRPRAPLRARRRPGSRECGPRRARAAPRGGSRRCGATRRLRASSPMSSCSWSRSWRSCPVAARIPTAIGRSYRLPSLGSSAGARLTVMRRLGNSNRELMIALRTRSLLSRTVASGRPTIANLGSPPVM